MKFQVIEKNKLKCYHCGEEIKNSDYKIEKDNLEYIFCCNGCLEAFKFIHNIGYGEYYKNREDYASKPEENSIDNYLYDFIENELKAKSNNSILEKVFYIKGIHCASCVWINEKVLSELNGILEANVSLSTNRVQLKWDPKKITLSEISKTIQKIGYQLIPINEQKETKVKIQSDTLLKKMAVAGFFMGNNMLISVALYAGYFDYMDPTMKQFFHWMSLFLTTPVFLYSASEFFTSAFIAIKKRILATDLLTSVGISLAYFYSFYITITNQVQKEVFFDAINFVVFVILIGRFIESRLKLKTWYYKTNLSSLNPEIVRVLKNYHLILNIKNKYFININKNNELKSSDYEYKNIQEVQEKEIILVFPQEIVPLDCVLLNEAAEVDEASLTGEFKPILKKSNDFITSGSKNITNQILFLQVKHNSKESTITKILELAENSLLQKSKFETISSKVSAIFIGIVLVLGVLTFYYWMYYKNDLSNAILYTLSILIVACPCALSLSIPTAIIVGLQELFAKGCLVQNSSLLEIISKTKIIAFDKTGTLTEGKLNIYKIYSYLDFELLKKIIIFINNYKRKLQIQHPISLAFFDLEDKNSIDYHKIKKDLFLNLDFNLENKANYYPGLGFELENNFYKIKLGSEEWFKESGYYIDYQIQKEEGDILVYLGLEGPQKEIIAIFLLKDRLKENLDQIIQNLNKNYKTILLTGDVEENAKWLQKKIQIQKIYYSLKPSEKAEIIKKYQNKNKVAMIGDGINDTIALKQADVGISFIQASNLALYSADIFLINNDFRTIVFLFEFTKYIFKKIKQNLTMSLVYNFILLPLAFFGYLSPFVGAVFMSLSSITVVSNSLSIKKYNKI